MKPVDVITGCVLALVLVGTMILAEIYLAQTGTKASLARITLTRSMSKNSSAFDDLLLNATLFADICCPLGKRCCSSGKISLDAKEIPSVIYLYGMNQLGACYNYDFPDPVRYFSLMISPPGNFSSGTIEWAKLEFTNGRLQNCSRMIDSKSAVISNAVIYDYVCFADQEQ